MDDPFDQNNAGMPNVTLIDGDSSGPDNRGADPGVGSGFAMSDTNGVARYPVTMSMQPGNNYRGAASTSSTIISATTQAEADANTPPQDVRFTDMLTVWRRVWLELDSMAAGSDISFSGEIDAITNNSPHTGDGTVELDVPDINDNGRFEGGTMTVAGGGTYTIIDNIDVTVDDDYTMSTAVAATDDGLVATVVDDDTAVLPHTPDGNIPILNERYKYAFVEFSENIATRDVNNAFVATLANDPGIITSTSFENADVMSNPNLWVAHIVTCYQSHHLAPSVISDPAISTTADGDPDPVFHTHGGTGVAGDTALLFALTPFPGPNVSTFYLETNVDYIRQAGQGYWPGHIPRTLAFKEPRTIGHEIGHQFGIVVHTPGTLVGPWDGGDYGLDAAQLSQIRDSESLNSE